MQPRDQISPLKSAGYSFTTSGDAYLKVISLRTVCSPLISTLLMPISATFTPPSFIIKMFSGFMSACRMNWLCATFRAFEICAIKYLTNYYDTGGNLYSFLTLICLLRSPLAQYSRMKIISFGGLTKLSTRFTIFGCQIFCRNSASFLKFA